MQGMQYQLRVGRHFGSSYSAGFSSIFCVCLRRLHIAAASMTSFSWEQPSWEDPVDTLRLEGSDDDEPDAASRLEPPTKKEAEEGLAEFLITKKLLGKMSAKDACTIAYWCKHAGVGGLVAKIALKPNSASGHFERKFNSALGLTKIDAKAMSLRIPGLSPATMGRVCHTIPFIPPHEALHAEMVSTPGLAAKLKRLVDLQALPRSYMDHPVARASRHSAMPLALYLDGVPYTKNDGLLGFWVYNVLTGVRQYLGA